MHLIRFGWCRAAVAAVASAAAALVVSVPARAATLPAGFTETLYASGLSNPTAMQFAPDGRLFVCQQGGALRVVVNGVLQATPFVTLSVNSSGERGLLGVAFDPDFATNQYVYVYYTTSTAPIHNRISRFTANGNVAVPGSEFVVMDLDTLSGATNHNGGAIAFGADGKLYVAVGDNANSAFAQSLSTRHGKMLRLNPDGSIPGDNPTTYAGIAGTPTGDYRSIWATGLRNPFTFALNYPGAAGPVLMINDVGQGAFEEANPGSAGANFGWPTTSDGDFNPATYPAFTRPRYAYPNDASTCAITGGAFYPPVSPNFPAQYQNMYFFADYCAGWIRYVDPTIVQPYPLQASAAQSFATGISLPVDLKVGTDGALYYLARGSGSIFRVQWGQSAPSITSPPANRTVSVGQSATFSVTASGTPPLAYQWQRNDTDIPGATATSYTFSNAQLANNGDTFRVRVTNGAGNVLSNRATLTVTTNQPPSATITAPAAGALYAGGMSVAFAGTGTDPEDGTVPAARFTWRVDFHHDTHVHPFIPATSGLTGGAFEIPTTGETSANVWYRLVLTVTDSGGRATTVQRDIHPRVVRLTLATSPAGLQLTLDGQPVAHGTAVDSVVGIQRTIGAATQTSGGATYVFRQWSDGGGAQRVLGTPGVNSTYTATFAVTSATSAPAAPAGLVATVNGATVRLAWNRAAGAQGYRLEAGSTSGAANLVNALMGDVDSFEGLVPPGTYFVRVRAVNGVGTSGASNQVAVTVTTAAACVSAPPVPAGVTGQAGGLLAALAWRPSPAATGYVLDVGLTSGATHASAPLGNVTAFQTVAAAGSYFARVRAVNACGSSGPSVEVPLTLGCSATAVVPGTLGVTSGGGAATFSWLAPLGATSYRLRAGTAPGASNVVDTDVGAVTSVGVPLAGVPAGTYYVRVVAVSACGIGAPSNEVALTVP